MNYKSYLGDSVYANFDGINIILTTENGGPPSNEIVLEANVWYELKDYVQRIQDTHMAGS